MNAQKVVKIEVLDDCDGVVLVFGIDGERGAASHHSRWGRGCFTETARLHVEWEDGGRQLSHFHNWIAAVPRLHPTETLADAVSASCAKLLDGTCRGKRTSQFRPCLAAAALADGWPWRPDH